MKLSKIGSANTYTRCLKQLDEWGYIQYLPSYNPLKGSLVNLYDFDNSTDKGCDNSSDNSPVRVVRPSINSLNNTNKETIKPNKQKRREGDQLSKTEARTESSSSRRTKSKISIPPPIDEVKDFFSEIKSSTDQAEQFHNHFQSNGWLVGGKAKMKDWKAAARNWVKRSQKFSSTSSAQDRLNTNQDKDYSIPL